MVIFKKISFRTAEIVIILFVAITAVFFLMHATSDRPSLINNPNLDEGTKLSLTRKYGLDDPLYMQLLEFWKGVFTGNLGVSLSLHAGQEITSFIWPKFGRSLAIAAISTVIFFLVGIGIGVMIGLRPRGFLDRFFQISISILIGIPAFVFTIFFVIGASRTGFPYIYEDNNPVTWLLPIVTIAIPSSMYVAKYIRTNLIKSLDSQHAKLALAKGLSPYNVVVRHLLKEALFTIATLLPTAFVGAIVSSVLIETFFAIPGLGRLYTDSIGSKDYNILLTVTMFLAILTALAFWARDFLYLAINPMQRRRGVN